MRTASGAFKTLGQFLVGGVNLSAEVSGSGSVGGVSIISFSEQESQTNLGVQADGGVNLSITDALGIRAGVDYLRVFAEDSDADVFRSHVGVVIFFGR